MASHLERRAADSFLPGITTGFRNSRFAEQFVEFEGGPRVEYRDLGGGKFLHDGATWQVISWSAPALLLEAPSGQRIRFRVTRVGSTSFVHSPWGDEVLVEAPRFPAPQDSALKGGFIAPMPGKVVKVNVKAGDAVKAGQVLLVLEAMKMEQATRSPTDGVVKSVPVREGDQVTAGQVLVTLEE